MQKTHQRDVAKPRSDGQAARATPGGNRAKKGIVLALDGPQDTALPRPRIRLRSAMRKAGLDEWKIAWLLNYKIDSLAESAKSSDNKLLLDYLKEASRHLDPAGTRTATGHEVATIEMVHNVPRPERSQSEQ